MVTSTTRSWYRDGAAGHPRRHVQALPRGEGRHDAAGVLERHDGACGEARSPPVVRSLRDLANAESAPVLTLSPFFFPDRRKWSTASSSSTSACHATAPLLSRVSVSRRVPLSRRVVGSGKRRPTEARTDPRRSETAPSPSLTSQAGLLVPREVHRQEVQGRRLERGRELVRGQVHEQVLAVRGDRGADAGRRRRRRRAGRALIASLYE